MHPNECEVLVLPPAHFRVLSATPEYSDASLMWLNVVLTYIPRSLARQSARIAVQDSELHRACARGDRSAVDHLIAAGAGVRSRGINNQTPLMSAARRGMLHAAEPLLNPTNLDDADNDGNTALHLAVMNGHCDFAKRLRASGADCEKLNHDHLSPLMLAKRKADEMELALTA